MSDSVAATPQCVFELSVVYQDERHDLKPVKETDAIMYDDADNSGIAMARLVSRTKACCKQFSTC